MLEGAFYDIDLILEEFWNYCKAASGTPLAPVAMAHDHVDRLAGGFIPHFATHAASPMNLTICVVSGSHLSASPSKNTTQALRVCYSKEIVNASYVTAK